MKIRSGFVSNSSSSSFVVIGSGTQDAPKPGTVLKFDYDGETQFGWGPELVFGMQSRLNWAILQAEYYPELCGAIRAAIESVGCTWDDTAEVDGYIDHQSIGNSLEIFDSTSNMVAFLFGENSFIRVDNDNH